MGNIPEAPSDDYLEECKQKILAILNDEKLRGCAPYVCAAALNEWAGKYTIYQIRALPLVDQRRLFGN